MRRIVAFAVIAAVIFSFPSCMTKKLEAKQIKRDFVAEHLWAYPMRNYFGEFPRTDYDEIELDYFKVRARINDEEKDEMIVDLQTTDPGDNIKICGEYSLTYLLINDEWALKDFRVIKETVIPLKKSNFSRDEILLALSIHGYSNVEKAIVSGRMTDLEGGKDIYKIQADIGGEKAELLLTFTFSPGNRGWSVLNSECKEI